jgi:hypothetical protein
MMCMPRQQQPAEQPQQAAQVSMHALKEHQHTGLKWPHCCLFAQGETTRTLPKAHVSSTHWAFVTGGSVGSLPAGSQQAAAGMLERLLLGLDQQLQEKPGVLPNCGCCLCGLQQ